MEYKEKYVKESNSCLPEFFRQHYPEPTSVTKQPPSTENQVISGLHDTPLSDEAREAFFQTRNSGVGTFKTGIKPAMSENGTQPLKIFPDYTENAALEDIFLPPTMTCNDTIPYGPEPYMPFTNANGNTAVTSVSQPLSRLSSPANSSVSVTSEASEHSHYNQPQASYSPSSGYQSSPSMPATSPESNLLDSLSPHEIDDTDLDKLIDSLNSEPQVQTEALTKSLKQGDPAFDGIIDELLAESLLNDGVTFPDLPIYDQYSYHKHNGN